MEYDEALTWLYRRQRFGIKLGLDNMRALLEALGNPQEQFRAFHVTGTNGKGSVCALLAACLQAAGHHVGLYTSPHLVSFRERIQVNGQPVSPEEVAELVARIRPLVEALEARRIQPTFFEVVTAMAFDHFRARGLSWAVVEVGLGGRLDATNLCRPIASVITNVGLDHTEQLGTSVQAIAREKAGILRSGIPCATGARREPLDVVAREATKQRAPLRVVRRPEDAVESLEGTTFTFPYQGTPRPFRIRLLGDHQALNAALTLATLEATQAVLPVSPEAAQTGLAQTQWPGRLEIVDRNPLSILDGAHNADAMDTFCTFLDRHFPDRSVAACVGVLRDKNATKMLSLLAPRVGRLVLTEVPNARTLFAKELERCLPSDAPSVTVLPSVADALRSLYADGEERLRLVTGSLFLVGEARAQILRLERDPPIAQPVYQ